MAYIDASHLEPYSRDPWSEDGIGHFAEVLMRNGYLPLLAPDLTPERLQGAGLLASIAPARPLSPGERKSVRDFVESGGVLICMVGAEEVHAGRDLPAEFDFRVAPSPVPPEANLREPEPLGAFRQVYAGRGERGWYVRFNAGWPVRCAAPDALVEIKWVDGAREEPIVVHRPVGNGLVTVIGDTCFAMNKNLAPDGEKLHENVHFWWWLLAPLTGAPWDPPEKSAPAEPSEPVEGGILEMPDLDEPIEPEAAP